jgi:hypothetical protein
VIFLWLITSEEAFMGLTIKLELEDEPGGLESRS